jgi:hypothetical protein
VAAGRRYVGPSLGNELQRTICYANLTGLLLKNPLASKGGLVMPAESSTASQDPNAQVLIFQDAQGSFFRLTQDMLDNAKMSDDDVEQFLRSTGAAMGAAIGSAAAQRMSGFVRAVPTTSGLVRMAPSGMVRMVPSGFLRYAPTGLARYAPTGLARYAPTGLARYAPTGLARYAPSGGPIVRSWSQGI